MVAQLNLPALLAPLGQAVRVGSSALGLMVRRDIDITVICPRLDAALLARFAAIGAQLMQHEAVDAVRFRNDAGRWNREPDRYPDGLYLGFDAIDVAGDRWSFDIWAVDQPDRQPDLAHLQSLPPRLDDATRRVILQIKADLLDPSTGAPGVPSAHVYAAVLDGGVTTLAEFRRWHVDAASPAF